MSLKFSPGDTKDIQKLQSFRYDNIFDLDESHQAKLKEDFQ